MKVVVLCGLGTRVREETEFRPKPMVEIGGCPILCVRYNGLHTEQGFEVTLADPGLNTMTGAGCNEFASMWMARLSC
jgi:hypothetical protein